jgi:hypothetical protein
VIHPLAGSGPGPQVLQQLATPGHKSYWVLPLERFLQPLQVLTESFWPAGVYCLGASQFLFNIPGVRPYFLDGLPEHFRGTTESYAPLRHFMILTNIDKENIFLDVVLIWHTRLREAGILPKDKFEPFGALSTVRNHASAGRSEEDS